MKPIDFPEANIRLGAPKGWYETKHGKCEPLPVQVRPDGARVSRWRVTQAEAVCERSGNNIEDLIIEVVFFGSQPPIAVHTLAFAEAQRALGEDGPE